MALRDTLRMLWEQYSVWTRLAIMNVVAGSPDQDLVIARLLRNPKDFEKALRPFYGDKVAAEFRKLLTDHLVIAAELVKASKAGNTNAAADTEKRWYENADQIAELLSRIILIGILKIGKQCYMNIYHLLKQKQLLCLHQIIKEVFQYTIKLKPRL